MLDRSDVIAFASATDLRRARAFYEQVLGLRPIEQNDFACVFDANATMLRITAVAEVARPGYTRSGHRLPAPSPYPVDGVITRHPCCPL